MADFRQQLLTLLSSNGDNSLVQSETTVNERTIPAENGANIVIQQRRETERGIKKVQPQLDFTSPDFCGGETIKLFNKMQLLPEVPYNLLKLDYRTIRNTKCLIATAQVNFGDPIEGHEDFPPIVEMTVSNKWAKLLQSLIGTSNVKYIIATRCNMEKEQSFNGKEYATMKFEYAKTILTKHMDVCDDETVNINCEEPNLNDDAVKRAVRRSSVLLSRSTYEIYRKNLIWDEAKYNESMANAKNEIVRKSLKRKANKDLKEAEKVVVLEKDVNENEKDSVTVENVYVEEA